MDWETDSMDNRYKDQLYHLGTMMKHLYMELDHIKISQGKLLSELNKKKISKNIQDYEFKKSQLKTSKG